MLKEKEPKHMEKVLIPKDLLPLQAMKLILQKEKVLMQKVMQLKQQGTMLIPRDMVQKQQEKEVIQKVEMPHELPDDIRARCYKTPDYHTYYFGEVVAEY